MSDPQQQMQQQQHQQQQDPGALLGAYQPIAACNTVEHRYEVPFVSFTQDPATSTVYQDPGEIFVREVTFQVFGRHFAYVQLYYQRAWFKLPKTASRSQWPQFYFFGHVDYNAGYSEPTWPLMQRWVKQAVEALVQQAIGGQPTCVMLDANGKPARTPESDQMIAAYTVAEKATSPTARKVQAETVPLSAEEAGLGQGEQVPAGMPPDVDVAAFQQKQQQEMIAQQQESINRAKAEGKQIKPSNARVAAGAPQPVQAQPAVPQAAMPGAPQPAGGDAPAVELP